MGTATNVITGQLEREKSTNTALLVIDVQKGLDDPRLGKRNNPQAESNIGRLLAHWRMQQRPVIHIQHDSITPDSPLQPGLDGHAFKDEAIPLIGEIQFSKNVNSAFIGTNLEQHLRDNSISDLVIVGLTTDHCISTTTRMAANLGFTVTVVADATAAHEKISFDGKHYSAQDIHMINLASLNDEFCRIVSCQEILSENLTA